MDIEIRNERERLIARQAVLAFREVEAAGAAAEYGQGMAALEAATLTTGRRQMRQVLGEALQSQAEAQKKGRPCDAHAAARGRGSNASRPKR
jgi:hypothetical protein